MVKEDRQKIAALIVELSDNKLQPGNTKAGWIPLKYESGPNSVAVVVSNSDRVSFLIRSTDLLNRVKAEGFNAVPAKLTAPAYKDKFHFLKLSLSEIQAHKALFKEIVMESVGTILDRRPKN